MGGKIDTCHGEIDIWKDRYIERQIDGKIDIQMERYIYRWKDRQIDGKIDRWKNR